MAKGSKQDGECRLRIDGRFSEEAAEQLRTAIREASVDVLGKAVLVDVERPEPEVIPEEALNDYDNALDALANGLPDELFQAESKAEARADIKAVRRQLVKAKVLFQQLEKAADALEVTP